MKYEVRGIEIKGITKIDLFAFKIFRNCIQFIENDENLKSANKSIFVIPLISIPRTSYFMEMTLSTTKISSHVLRLPKMSQSP